MPFSEIGDLNRPFPFLIIIWNPVVSLLMVLVLPVGRWQGAQINLLMVIC